MTALSPNDLAQLQKLVRQAITDSSVRAGIAKGKLPSGAETLSPAAMDAFRSITSEELAALASIYNKMVAKGASRDQLLKYSIIF